MEFQPVIEFIQRYDKFILTVHETPDGDALGSEYAMLRALQQLGKTAQIFNADPAPSKFTFVDGADEFTVLRSEDQLPPDIGEYVLIIMDVNDINNIGQIKPLLLPRVQEYFIIDHHDSEGDLQNQNLIQKAASSTSEILYRLFREMQIEIDFAMAQALFMGIVFDTGSFIYPKTTAVTFNIARELVEAGVNPNHVHANVFESNSISSLLLMSKVLATLELEFDEHVAIQTMTKETIAEANGKYEEADQIINIPLRSKDVRVSIFFKENPAGLKRCSMRSKGDIDVAVIAQSYGGGGHKTAAGFKCPKSFAAIKKELLEKLKRYFE
jgi:phosphoesterase RecJ-like protein